VWLGVRFRFLDHTKYHVDADSIATLQLADKEIDVLTVLVVPHVDDLESPAKSLQLGLLGPVAFADDECELLPRFSQPAALIDHGPDRRQAPWVGVRSFRRRWAESLGVVLLPNLIVR
jgi:hypothetical protein